MTNPILEELWKVKDDIARECEYDLDKLAVRLRQRQEQNKRRVVDFSEEQTGNRAARD